MIGDGKRWRRAAIGAGAAARAYTCGIMVTLEAPPAAPVIGTAAPLALALPPAWALSDQALIDLCSLNEDREFEFDELGRLVIMSGAGGASSERAFDFGGQLFIWMRGGGGGRGTTADGFFRLGGRTVRAPDVAWISPERARQIAPGDEGIWRICPDFVVEIVSPSDQLRRQQEKMELWVARGVRLGWLIDPFTSTAHIYRPGRSPEVLERPDTLSGEGVLRGFTADLTLIWRDAD